MLTSTNITKIGKLLTANLCKFGLASHQGLVYHFPLYQNILSFLDYIHQLLSISDWQIYIENS